MDPLAKAYLERQVQRIEKRQFRELCRDIREQQKKTEPLRRACRERLKEGVKGDGFVMKPTS